MRGIIGMALAIGLLTSLAIPALADTTTGNISGTVTGTNGQPIANVAVVAVSPSGRYSSKTDAKGFFNLPGVSPDTYSVSFTVGGYGAATVNGVTVSPTQTTTVNQSLSAQLKSIGQVTTRASGVPAFQPQQPVDTYSVDANQIQTLLGKSHAISETDLLIALPGATLDSSGYPVLRGGRENDEGFQFEGIDYTDAFTHQFVNSLALNGVQNFQLSPGAGDPSVGNVGTGQINATVKRGTFPAFGNAEFDARVPVFDHQISGEYGFANPTGNFSNYVSDQSDNQTTQCGRFGQNPNLVGCQLQVNLETDRDLIENAVFKFGHNESQSLQLFYQNEIDEFYGNVQFQNPSTLLFRNVQPDYLDEYSAFLGLPISTVEQIMPLEYGQTSLTQTIGRPAYTYNQPNDVLKLQYSNTLNSSTFFTLKAYKVNATTVFDFPYSAQTCEGPGYNCDTYSLQGGQRTGMALDTTVQVGTKNLVGFGAKYEFVHPIDTYQSASVGFESPYFGGNANLYYDFISGASGLCGPPADYGPGNCYLASFLGTNAAPRLPDYNQAPTVNRHDTGYYISDQFQATDRLKFTGGVRVDQSSFDYPSNVNFGSGGGPTGYSSGIFLPISTGFYTSGPFASGCPGSGAGPTGAACPNPALDVYSANDEQYRTSSTVQPRLGFAYQFTLHDSLTGEYGRSVELPPIAFIDNRFPRADFAGFAGIPADTMSCGPTANRTCNNYADELYWAYQNTDGVPLTPIKPSTYNDYDVSYQHDFGKGLSMKLTPFYRRGYDVASLFSSQLQVNGVPQFDANGNPIFGPSQSSNLGRTYTTGVEAYMTKTSAYGLSGSLSITYLNEFSNVVPLSGSEDFFPSIPAPSLFLGNLYRVGFLSPLNATLALQYKTHNGWRVNPIIGANDGYPIGAGLLTAYEFAGKNYNLPNTNITSSLGSAAATSYVDPANPGTIFNPNVAATRGTPEKNSPGGVLSAPRVALADFDLEYQKPGTHNTFGVLVSNLFSQIYTQPVLNSRFQPAATGISGPRSGTTSTVVLWPGLGYYNYVSYRGNNQPYLITPSGAPTDFRLYYQISL